MNEAMIGVLTVLAVIAWIVLILVVIYFFLVFPGRTRRALQASFLGHWYAHRGFHDNNSEAPENSLAAFKKAVEAGYGIELDVQLTKDEKVVVFHDNTLKRVCGVDAPVNSMTYDELSKLRLLNTDERIPLFSEVLGLVDGKVPLIVEIKMVNSATRVCVLANEFLKNYKGQYCIESFHPFAVQWFRKNRPEIMRGQLAANFWKEGEIERPDMWLVHFLLTNVLARPDFISYSCKAPKNLSFVLCTKAFGALPVAWTIKSEESLKKSSKYFKIFIFEGFRPEKVKI